MSKIIKIIKKAIIALVVFVIICAVVLIYIGSESEKESSPELTPPAEDGNESVIGNIPEGSILLFQNDEGAARLNKDMEEGRVPTVCHAMYDQMGSRPDVEITDPELITEVYNRLGHMIIGDESNESITDCYHYISFTLQDGTTVGWHFEGAGLLCWGKNNYTVTEAGTLWSMVTEIQDAMMAEQ